MATLCLPAGAGLSVSGVLPQIVWFSALLFLVCYTRTAYMQQAALQLTWVML